MIHIGTKEYYENISHLIDNLNMVLLEGVTFKSSTEMGKYDKTAKLFGLYTQKNNLKITEDINKLNIDIAQNVFEEEYLKINLFERLKLLKYSIALFILSKNKKKAKEELIKYFAYTEDQSIKLIDPGNHYSYKHDKSPFDFLITNKRNDYIEQNFKNFINENKDRKYRYDVGIIFGAAHMPVFYNILKNHGYKWKMKQKIQVF